MINLFRIVAQNACQKQASKLYCSSSTHLIILTKIFTNLSILSIYHIRAIFKLRPLIKMTYQTGKFALLLTFAYFCSLQSIDFIHSKISKIGNIYEMGFWFGLWRGLLSYLSISVVSSQILLDLLKFLFSFFLPNEWTNCCK